jgi:hypothetical protein
MLMMGEGLIECDALIYNFVGSNGIGVLNFADEAGFSLLQKRVLLQGMIEMSKDEKFIATATEGLRHHKHPFITPENYIINERDQAIFLSFAKRASTIGFMVTGIPLIRKWQMSGFDDKSLLWCAFDLKASEIEEEWRKCEDVYKKFGSNDMAIYMIDPSTMKLF